MWLESNLLVHDFLPVLRFHAPQLFPDGVELLFQFIDLSILGFKPGDNGIVPQPAGEELGTRLPACVLFFRGVPDS